MHVAINTAAAINRIRRPQPADPKPAPYRLDLAPGL
jgi:hypothetical protein